MTDRTFAQCLESFADLPKPLAMYCAHVARTYKIGHKLDIPALQFDVPLCYINNARVNWAGNAGGPMEIMRYEDWGFQF